MSSDSMLSMMNLVEKKMDQQVTDKIQKALDHSDEEENIDISFTTQYRMSPQEIFLEFIYTAANTMSKEDFMNLFKEDN